MSLAFWIPKLDYFFPGDNIAYIYPDLKTAIVGKFERGLLVSIKRAQTLKLPFGPLLQKKADYMNTGKYGSSSWGFVGVKRQLTEADNS